MSDKYFVIDFDSTFIRFEALDELAGIALQNDPEHDQRLNKVKEYTNLAMEGKLSFPESLGKRIQMLEANKDDIHQLVRVLKRNISTSIKRNEDFFKKYADRIYIISGGFKEYIAPIVGEYNIREDHIFANSFEFDSNGKIVGFDQDNYLAQENGKVKQLQNLNIEGDIYVIGDGYTDFQIRESGLAQRFFAFTENIERVNLLEKADHVTPSFDEFLFKNKLPMAISYPKNRIKLLIMNNIPTEASEQFSREGYDVEFIHPEINVETFREKIKEASILAVNGYTQIPDDAIEEANRLLAIGIYGIDKGFINQDLCRKNGIVIFHAPHTNTRSVAELAIGEMIMLLRQVPDQTSDLHKGLHHKIRKDPYELFGKNLGIIGYGDVGKQLGTLAESLGMQVYFYDKAQVEGLGNAKATLDLQELLEISDIISLHITDEEANRNFINEEAFEWMKEGAIFLNLSCEKAVDHGALAIHLKSGKLGGAGIDRFPNKEGFQENGEFRSNLQKLPNVVLTPYMSGNTAESSHNAATFVTRNIIDFINTGSIHTGVNFPDIQLPSFDEAHRLLHIHEDHPGMMATIANVFSAHGINILAQQLKTFNGVGYLITDISKDYDDNVVDAIKEIPYAIRLRILY